jgi:hypothetical protein
MARQPTKTAAAKKAAASNKEETVTTTATAPADEQAQSTPQNTENTEPQAAAAPEVIDTTGFDEALKVALAEMDQSTGTLAPAQLEPVIKAYHELDGSKAKAKVRASIEQGVKEALDPEHGNIPNARALNTIRQELTKSRGGGKKADATPSDPTEAFVQQVVGLQLAYGYVTQNVPEGVSDDWQTKANELAQKTVNEVDTLAKYTGEGEKPEVSALAQRALKLAQGKSVKGGGGGGPKAPFTGTRRDIGKHIQAAFADKASGDFLTIAQIVTHHSEEYGNEAPSPGAVSARLFPRSGKCTLEGVEPVDAKDGQPKGARKS